jgi:hypothetical protein
MGTAKQYITGVKSGAAGSGVHIAEHENSKVAGAIIQDILGHFAFAPLPIPENLNHQLKPSKPPFIPNQMPHPTGNSSVSNTMQKTGRANDSNIELQVLKEQAGKDDNTSGSILSTSKSALIPSPSPHLSPEPKLPLFVAPSPPTAVDPRDLVSATVQTFHEILQADAKLHAQRASFVNFWQLVRLAHPVPACSVGAESLLENLQIWWPYGASELWKPPKDMLEHDICGNSTEAPGVAAVQPYYACRGSNPEHRGYTCGMWMLFHALAAGCAPVCALLSR